MAKANPSSCFVKCVLPDASDISFSFPANYTVEQVKKCIFTDTPGLFALSRDDFVIGLNDEELCQDETATFITITRTTEQLYKTCRPVVIKLISREFIKMKAAQNTEQRLILPMLEPSPRNVRRSIIGNPETLASFENAEKEGYLRKEGHNIKSWKKRWFILKDNFISYFRTKNDTKPINSIPLQIATCCVKGEKRNCFIIYTRHRTWNFAAETAKEMNEWMDAIQKCLVSLGKTQDMHRASVGAPPSPGLKEGWLTKSGGNRKNWKRRWCVLKDQLIFYYKTAKTQQPSGIIPLQDCYVEAADERYASGRKNGFSISTRHRTYDLFADTPEEMKEWMACIVSNIYSGSRVDQLKEAENSNKALWKRSAGDLQLGLSSQIVWDSKKTHLKSVPKSYLSILQTLQGNLFDSSSEPSSELLEIREKFGIVDCTSQNLETMLFHYHVSRINKIPGMLLLTAVTTDHPVPSILPSQLFVKFHFPDLRHTKAISCRGDDTVQESVKDVLMKKQKGGGMTGSHLDTNSNSFTNGINLSDYLVKLCDTSEFILDCDIPLNSLVSVRENLKRRKRIEFSLIEKSSMYEQLLSHTAALNAIQLDTQPESEEMATRECYSAADMSFLFELRIICVENFSPLELMSVPGDTLETKSGDYRLYIECCLYTGVKLIGTIMRTGKQAEPLWGDRVTSKLKIQNIPREAKLCITLYMRSGTVDTPLAWVNAQVFDSVGLMYSGIQRLTMWPANSKKADPLGTCELNQDPNALILNIEFPQTPFSIAYMRETHAVSDQRVKPLIEEREELRRIVQADPLYWLSEEQKALVWKYRYYFIMENPKALPKVLLSVDWTNPLQVQEAHGLIWCWPKLPPVFALELLDRDFPDTDTRRYAVECLEAFTDNELVNYLLQLVQTLKYESYHSSALALFLLRRALQNKNLVGHAFFWHLKSELHLKEPRFQLLLEAYLTACGEQREQLLDQVQLIDRLKQVTTGIKKEQNTSRRTKLLQAELEAIPFVRPIKLPIHPGWEVDGFILESCKWMDSFTVPLWLVFKNVDPCGSPIRVIFKSGDDLRQDVLSLQLIRLMDELWKSQGLDFGMIPYRCLSTGEEMGLIEIVPDSTTTADIQKSAGGAVAAFSKTPLANYLSKHNPTEESFASAVDNFTLSVAGYCVATYVLGIGDRHNDNIMVAKSGHLFHIDFAHFLGNIIKFGVFKRERAPFVFTPEFAHVIRTKDIDNFQRFTQACCKGYNVIRQYSHTFIVLFLLMLTTGIPQLSTIEDLEYLRDSFALQKTDEEAEKIFIKLIDESLNTKTTQINNAIHILAHPN